LVVVFLPRHFDQHLEIVDPRRQVLHGRDLAFQAGDLAHLLLRGFLAVPEAGLAHFHFEPAELSQEALKVKDTSGARRGGP